MIESSDAGRDVGALSDLTVVELGEGVAGAFCGQLLRQLGARVVMFETPNDSASNWESLPSGADIQVQAAAERAYLHAGKDRGNGDVGGEGFMAEMAHADIVVRGVEWQDADTASRLRDEYEAYRGVAPAVVFVALTPFGVSDAFGTWCGGDLQAQAVSGWPAFVGNPTEAPLVSNFGGGPLQHGLSAAGAALAAVVSGRGDFVDIAESQVIAAWIRMYSHTYRLYGVPLKRAGLRAPGSSGRYPHSAFRCKDGLVSIICRSADEWQRFILMIGSPPWALKPRYLDFYKMATQYPDEVDALVTPWFEQRTKQQLSLLAAEYRVPMAPIRTTAEVMEDEQLKFRQFFRADATGRECLPQFPVIWRAPADPAE